MSAERYTCRPITLADRAAVETIRAAAGHTLSAYAFSSLFLWQEGLGLSLCLGRDAFFVRARSQGENAWFFPCGSEAASVEFLQTMLATQNFTLRNLRAEDVAFLAARFPDRFLFQETRSDAEYLYLRQEQVMLTGKAFKNLRGKVHRAQNRSRWETLELTAEMAEAAKTVVQAWRARRGAPGDLEAAMTALNNWETLGMSGVLLRDETGFQAVAAGAMIASDVFDLHVTKTLRPGLEGYLKWELYQRLPETVVWINQEDDMDIPGLRTTKTEAVPTKLVPLWKGTAL